MFDIPPSPGRSAGVASIHDLECIDLSTLADRDLGELISEVERRVARLHAVHEAGWSARRQPCGSITWTSPLAHVHVSPPSAYRVPAPQDGPVSPGARSNW